MLDFKMEASMDKSKIMYFRSIISVAAIAILFFFSSCSPPQLNVIEQAIRTLESNNIVQTHEAMLLFKRYRYYLAQLEKGRSYVDWRQNDNPPIYNPTAFMRMMDEVMIQKIVGNTIAGREAFYGITGLFERAYLSEVDSSLDSYIIYVPHSYNPAEKYPLIIMLHGYGDSAYLNPYTPVHFDFLKACELKGVIMAAPRGRHNPSEDPMFYRGEGERDVLQVINLVKKAYTIDEKRVYLTGDSMGGYGTYYIAGRHPELFAAIAPVCGFWSEQFIQRVDLNTLKGIPVYLVHCAGDKSVPVEESRSAYEIFKEMGADVVYREIDNTDPDAWDSFFGGHNAWDYAYEGTALIDWFLQHKQ